MGTNRRVYRARAKTWGLGESSTGKEQVAVEFQVLTEGASYESLVWYGYFTEQTFARTIESLRHCGWAGDDLANLAGLDANEVNLVVEDEEYEGRVTAKVQWVNKPGGLALKAPLSPERAKTFAAAMRDRIRAVEAAGGKRATSTPPARRAAPHGPPPPSAPLGHEPPPLDDADIPF